VTRVVGIDPGLTGGIACLRGSTLLAVHPMPIFGGWASGHDLADLLTQLEPDVIAVEQTQAMPKNGSVASYSLGRNTGIVLGVVETLGHPLTMLRPVEWKRANGLVGKDKNASRGLAMNLWPVMAKEFKRVKDDGKAEAALIARAYIYLWIKEQHAASTVS
jgi:crossover junction endodeoxyribonuclease RuvC